MVFWVITFIFASLFPLIKAMCILFQTDNYNVFQLFTCVFGIARQEPILKIEIHQMKLKNSDVSDVEILLVLKKCQNSNNVSEPNRRNHDCNVHTINVLEIID